MTLTIGLKGLSSLCIFSRPYSLGGKRFVDFNVNLILLEKLLFSIRVLVFCAIVFIGSLSSLVYSDAFLYTGMLGIFPLYLRI